MSVTTEAAPLAAPRAVDLPPANEFLSECQLKVLMALMDAAIPAVRAQESSPQPRNQDVSALYLPSKQYSELATKVRAAVSPLDPSSDMVEAYLSERPSDNLLFAQVLKCILSGLPPSKQRELRILLTVLG